MKTIILIAAVIFCLAGKALSQQRTAPAKSDDARELSEKKRAGSIQHNHKRLHSYQSRSRIRLQLREAQMHERQVAQAQKLQREAAKEQSKLNNN